MPAASTSRFVPVPDVETLDDWLSCAGDVVLFLHDPRCWTSRRAYDEVARVGGDIALIDVRAAPVLAREIEARTGVRHESPQVVVLRNGRPAWSASHAGITARAVTSILGATPGVSSGARAPNQAS